MARRRCAGNGQVARENAPDQPPRQARTRRESMRRMDCERVAARLPAPSLQKKSRITTVRRRRGSVPGSADDDIAYSQTRESDTRCPTERRPELERGTTSESPGRAAHSAVGRLASRERASARRSLGGLDSEAAFRQPSAVPELEAAAAAAKKRQRACRAAGRRRSRGADLRSRGWQGTLACFGSWQLRAAAAVRRRRARAARRLSSGER